MEPVGGLGVSKYLLQTQEERSVSTGIDSMRLMFQKLSNPGKDLALPLGKLVVEEGEGGKEDLVPGIIEFTGGAVFRKDKLAGSMDEREARGIMWITGEVARATLVVPCPGCAVSKTLPVQRHLSNLLFRGLPLNISFWCSKILFSINASASLFCNI